MDKKKLQLGMNPGTASHRLVKDLLFQFVKAAGHKCFRCEGELTRETFSIEHKMEWLDSVDPVGLFFDLGNIAYSHRSCNYGAAEKTNKVYPTVTDRKAASWQRYVTKYPYDATKRRQRYERNGS